MTLPRNRLYADINGELVDVTSIRFNQLLAKFKSRKELWHYLFEEEEGVLFWKVRILKTGFVGTQVVPGLIRGYRAIRVKRETIMEHRIVWEMYNPPLLDREDVRHEDGDKFNNAIWNLFTVRRELDRFEAKGSIVKAYATKKSCIGSWYKTEGVGNELKHDCKDCQRRLLVPTINGNIDVPEFLDECPLHVAYGFAITAVINGVAVDSNGDTLI